MEVFAGHGGGIAILLLLPLVMEWSFEPDSSPEKIFHSITRVLVILVQESLLEEKSLQC